jgi:chromate reductase, NAD(P)H dehydrogenase (quinone)
MRLLGISGSLRRGSYNAALLGAAAAECPGHIEFVVLKSLADLPAYDEDIDTVTPPLPVAALRAEIERADAVLIATPEYNASIPGALKNALDWASRPYATNVLRKKRVAVIGASTGLFGALVAQAELRKVLNVIGASVLDAALSVPLAHTAFTGDGRLREPDLALALRGIVHELLEELVGRAA